MVDRRSCLNENMWDLDHRKSRSPKEKKIILILFESYHFSVTFCISRFISFDFRFCYYYYYYKILLLMTEKVIAKINRLGTNSEWTVKVSKVML